MKKPATLALAAALGLAGCTVEESSKDTSPDSTTAAAVAPPTEVPSPPPTAATSTNVPEPDESTTAGPVLSPDLQQRAAQINNATLIQDATPGLQGPALLRAQVLLDRLSISPGEIDGVFGSTMQRMLAVWQRENKRNVTGVLSVEDYSKLTSLSLGPAIVAYTLTTADIEGPYAPQIPADLNEQAKLEGLYFRNVLEKLGEKFHASPKLLEQLNPTADWGKAGTVILVPAVLDTSPAGEISRIVVDESDSVLYARDSTGALVSAYPVTTGSRNDPLPIGDWKINGVAKNPPFHYNPKLFWDAEPDDTKARIPPGPNNPVGVVWIDLSKEHYGIHGTPEPSKIGKTESHGCIRLANWDAWELAQLVKPGIPVKLQP